MARTRSKPAPKKEASGEAAAPFPAQTLPPSVSKPPKLFVLPKDTSKDTRIVTLPNPANGTPSRYLFCPSKGFYEFNHIVAPKKTPRSWLITSEKSLENENTKEGDDVQESMELGTGYITKNADLFIATPIDILFLVLPALTPKNAKETKQHFLSLEDHLDTLFSFSQHLKALVAQHTSLKSMIERRMGAFCDTVDAGDETMYRICNSKVLHILVKKAERMCKSGLPASMEERFIKPTLDIPVMSIKREESTVSIVPATLDSQPSLIHDDSSLSTTTTTPSADSQTTVGSQSTATTSFSTTVEEEVTGPSLTTPPGVPHLLRLRTSLTYLLCSYIPPTLRSILQQLLQSPSSSTPDFTPLDAHLAALQKLKAEAAALRSISDNISRKRGYEDDEEKVAEREEKKRKKEEEEKKKKTESRGIKQLKKVDTSGMKKLSSFFTAKPAAKKA